LKEAIHPGGVSLFLYTSIVSTRRHLFRRLPIPLSK